MGEGELSMIDLAPSCELLGMFSGLVLYCSGAPQEQGKRARYWNQLTNGGDVAGEDHLPVAPTSVNDEPTGARSVW